MEVKDNRIKTIYLVDFENTHDAGMVGYDNLDTNDEIIIFYTVFNKVKSIYGLSNCTVQCELVSEGKQSVDMHIISYIGYMVGIYGEKCNIVIISIDRGYDKIVQILSKEKYSEDIKYKTASIVLENMYDDNIRKEVYKELIAEFGHQEGLEVYGCIRDNL